MNRICLRLIFPKGAWWTNWFSPETWVMVMMARRNIKLRVVFLKKKSLPAHSLPDNYFGCVIGRGYTRHVLSPPCCLPKIIIWKPDRNMGRRFSKLAINLLSCIPTSDKISSPLICRAPSRGSGIKRCQVEPVADVLITVEKFLKLYRLRMFLTRINHRFISQLPRGLQTPNLFDAYYQLCFPHPHGLIVHSRGWQFTNICPNIFENPITISPWCKPKYWSSVIWTSLRVSMWKEGWGHILNCELSFRGVWGHTFKRRGYSALVSCLDLVILIPN